MIPTIFGREPAAISAAVVAVVTLLSAFIFHFTPEQQSLINAAISALMAVVVAVMVQDGNLVTIIVGFGKAALALALGFGLQWDAGQQSTTITAISLVLALVLRQQVVAPVDASNITRSDSDVRNILIGMKRRSAVPGR